MPIPLPQTDVLPPGPVRTFAVAVHDVYDGAGQPATRLIERKISDDHNLEPVSRATISAVLRGITVPSWTKAQSIFVVLCRLSIGEVGEVEILARAHGLWLATQASELSSESAPTPLGQGAAISVAGPTPGTADTDCGESSFFLSYSRHDRTYAETLAASIQARGLPIWWDRELSTGHRFPREIQHRIQACVAFIVLLSPEAVASDWVQDELYYALHHRKLILPLMLRECDPPIRIISLQHEDVTDRRLPDEAFFDRILNRLHGPVRRA
jgi:hypothetical protein